MIKLFDEIVSTIKKFKVGVNTYTCFELSNTVIIFKNKYFTKWVHSDCTNDILDVLNMKEEILTIKFDYNTVAKMVNPNKRGAYIHGGN